MDVWSCRTYKLGLPLMKRRFVAGETCLLPAWHPAYSWHELDPGSRVEHGNPSRDDKRKPYKWDPGMGKVSMPVKGADHPVLAVKPL
jgi:hypothetical protein